MSLEVGSINVDSPAMFVYWLSKGSESSSQKQQQQQQQQQCVSFVELGRTVGGKATNLAKLSRGGFNVPPAFGISVAAHRRFLNYRKENDSWPPELEKDVRNAYEELIRIKNSLSHEHQETLVAVRSSGLDEDSAEHAFAGMHDTFLNVKSYELLSAIEKCWASVE